MRILLLGATGQLGWELRPVLLVGGDVVAPTRAELDLRDGKELQRCVRELRPDVVVNAAAYTQVDKAEEEPEVAMDINGRAPGILAEEASRHGGVLVHFSTDYVFDGRHTEPYVESDAAAPLNAYGRSKARGEQAIRESGARHLIFRLGWVYGLRRRNFLTTMLRLFHEQESLDVVADQVGSPTWCRTIAIATGISLSQVGLLGSGVQGQAANREEFWGTYHMSAAGRTSWYEFASRILESARKLLPADSLRIEQLRQTTLQQFDSLAARPACTLLSNERLHARFGVRLPRWEDQLSLCLRDLDLGAAFA